MKRKLGKISRGIGYQGQGQRSIMYFSYIVNASPPKHFDRCHRLQSSFNILREKSLAIYFNDSQFRRNRTLTFIVSKYIC